MLYQVAASNQVSLGVVKHQRTRTPSRLPALVDSLHDSPSTSGYTRASDCLSGTTMKRKGRLTGTTWSGVCSVEFLSNTAGGGRIPLKTKVVGSPPGYRRLVWGFGILDTTHGWGCQDGLPRNSQGWWCHGGRPLGGGGPSWVLQMSTSHRAELGPPLSLAPLFPLRPTGRFPDLLTFYGSGGGKVYESEVDLHQHHHSSLIQKTIQNQ